MSISGYVGINNRNPFNIKKAPGDDDWKGTLGHDAKGHAIFIDPVYSVRAFIRTLRSKIGNGKDTLRKVLADYAPASDGNRPDKYAEFVAHETNTDPDGEIRDLFLASGLVDPLLKNHLIAIMRAVVEYENFAGYQMPVETYLSGIAMYNRDFAE